MTFPPPEEAEREALRHAGEAAGALVSTVRYIPPSGNVGPCPFPCAICARLGDVVKAGENTVKSDEFD